MHQPKNVLAEIVRVTSGFSDDDILSIFRKSIIILSAPRSGSTLMFEQLSKQGSVWTIGSESHVVFRLFSHLRAENAALNSMALSEAHADAKTRSLLRRCFLYGLQNSSGVRYLEMPPQQRPESICFLEKTPRNALNIPFLKAVFPASKFIFLHRDPRQVVSSLIEAWGVGLQTGRFVTFRDLPNWYLPGWCFLLPRGWQAYRGRSIAEIAAFQWRASNQAIIDGLAPLAKNRWADCSYTDFITDPKSAIERIGKRLDLTLETGPLSAQAMTLSRTTLSRPNTDKWKRHAAQISPLLPALNQVQEQIDDFLQTE